MRTPNDIRLAENVDDIDLILGGHDHVYEINKVRMVWIELLALSLSAYSSYIFYLSLQVNNTFVLKSGTDFREFSVLTLTEESPAKVHVGIDRVEVTAKFAPDLELKEDLKEFEGEFLLVPCPLSLVSCPLFLVPCSLFIFLCLS